MKREPAKRNACTNRYAGAPSELSRRKSVLLTAGPISGMLVLFCANAIAQPYAAPQSIERIDEAAHRLHDVRQDYKEVGTLSDRMAKSLSLFYCAMNEGGLKARAKFDGSLEVHWQQGGGVTTAANGKNASFKHNMSVGLSAGASGKATGMTNFCVHFDKLGGAWADVDGSIDIEAEEDAYQYFFPNEGESDEAGIAMREIVPASDEQGLSDLFNLEPADFVNALIDGYVALGLDPDDPDHVRALLFGPAMLSKMDDIRGAVVDSANPVESAMYAMNVIKETAEAVPHLGETFVGAVDALHLVDRLEAPCDGFGPVDLSEACEFGEALLQFADAGIAAIGDFPGKVADLTASVAPLLAIHDALSDGTDFLVGWVETVTNRVNTILSNMPANVGRVDQLVQASASLAHQTTRLPATLAAAATDQFCGDTGVQRVNATVFSGYYCFFEYKVNVCAEDPSNIVKMSLQCDHYTNITNLAGQPIDWLIEEGERIQDEIDDVMEVVKDGWDRITPW